MCFCQVVLKRSWINAVADDDHNPYPNDPKKKKEWEELREKWKPKVDSHKSAQPKDPLPFPFNDLDPQVTLPLSEEFPWHTQIHRDAFSYGAAPPVIDKRTIVDLRFFGMVKPNWNNRVWFEDRIQDAYGMPQPTFRFELSEDDRRRSHRMMTDMEEVASSLGGYLPGSEPQFMEPGLALHVCGTTAAGKSDEDSCCNKDSLVWGTKNLYVGGTNVIPGTNGSNPTLTAMCFAIKGAEDIVKKLKESSGAPRRGLFSWLWGSSS
jgi:pyranose oxidase